MKKTKEKKPARFPFGSCEYQGVEDVAKWVFKNRSGLAQCRQRADDVDGFPTDSHVVMVMMQCASKRAWDLWSTASVLAELLCPGWDDALQWYLDSKKKRYDEIDDSDRTGLAVALLCVVYGINYAELESIDFDT